MYKHRFPVRQDLDSESNDSENDFNDNHDDQDDQDDQEEQEEHEEHEEHEEQEEQEEHASKLQRTSVTPSSMALPENFSQLQSDALVGMRAELTCSIW